MAFAFVVFAACAVTSAAAGQEAAAGLSTTPHSVVLVDLGGFRWDFATRDGAKNLLALGKSGVSAPGGMLPSFPSSTWPNTWTLVTGLYPGHHGMVADRFFDLARKARFASDDVKVTADGSWYGGVPLWALAEKNGLKTACIDWPGCAAEVGGARSALTVNGRPPLGADAKVKQIAVWLQLPPGELPHFIAAYFSEVDEAGRRFGPDAPETRAAVRAMDAMVGKLKGALDATHLPIDLVVVSDHGMAKTEGEWITLDALTDLSGFESEGALLYGSAEADKERVYNRLKQASANFVAYRLKNAPVSLHLAGNARAGDPVIVATGPYAVRAHVSLSGQADAALPKAIDGLNAQTAPEMKAIFFAAGPDIVEGKTIAPFENVHVYAWVAHLLGITAPKNDGSLNLLSGTLRDGGGDTGQ